MAALSLPAGIGFTASRPSLLYYGTEQSGPLGGASQWADRLGDRYQIDVSFPAMAMEPKGRLLIATLKLAKKQGLLIPIPQDGLAIGAPGNVRVNGGAQSGTSLIVDGFVPGYVAKMGQFFALTHNDRHYIHSLAADVTANGSGQAMLPLIEMLRVIPSDNDGVRFDPAYLEGFPQGDEMAWDIGLEPMLRPLTIRVKETR